MDNNKKIVNVSLALIVLAVIATVIYNYATTVNWNSKQSKQGLAITQQNSDTEYFGEEYICGRDKSLFIHITGPEDDIKKRTAQISLVNRQNQVAIVPNMKIQSITSDSVSYAYKENVVIINDQDEITFLINNIVIVEKCKKK